MVGIIIVVIYFQSEAIFNSFIPFIPFISVHLCYVMLCPFCKQRRHFGLQVHHPDALVRPVLVVWVQAHQEQVGDALAVAALQNGLVRVQLQAVVPVVGVRDVRNHGIRRVVLGAKRHLLDFLAALPVVNAERAVGIPRCGVQVLKHHVNGARDAHGLVKHGPFRAIRSHLGRMVRPKLQEVAELGGVHGIGGHRKPVVMALNGVVHGGARSSGGVAVGVPCRFNGVGRHAVVLALLPVARSHHARNNAVRVKLAEVGVDPRGDGHIRSTRVGVNGVLVLHGLKRDARVALVRVLCRQ